jgi:hypothetical protein
MGAIAIPRDFTDRLKRLMGLKFAPVDLTTHWEALRDLADEELDAAIVRAQRECEDFPSPKMLRAFVDDYRRDLPVPEEDWSRAIESDPTTFTLPDGTTKIHIRRTWKYFCDVCSDTGMRSFWCGASPSKRYPWLPLGPCGRRKEHGEHDFAEACPCAETNPDVMRKKAQAQQVTRKQANA